MRQAVRWIEEYRRFWEGSLDRLAGYLEDDGRAKLAREGKGARRHVSRVRRKRGAARGRLGLERAASAVFALARVFGWKQHKRNKRRPHMRLEEMAPEIEANQMNHPLIVSEGEWLVARRDLLAREKEVRTGAAR